MKDMPTRDYPHLDNATQFPGLGDPYAQYSQTFDYRKWTPGVVIRLFNVAWNARNIVEFESEDARDRWFDANAATTTTFKTLLHLQPDGTVKLPLPFEALARYNYLTVTFPSEPVTPNSADRVPTWCYFIRQCDQSAPSTTTLLLQLDAWQTFGYRIHFTSVQLERGHAPMAAIGADDYLSNPVANNAMLLAPDVTYGEPAAITTHSEFHPFGSGSKLVLFATTMSRDMLSNLELATPWVGTSSKPEYNDNPARWGHQYDVTGYEWHYGDADYSKLDVPVDPFASDYVPTGLHVYGTTADDAPALFKDIVAKTPQVMQTVQGMWLVGDDMVEQSEAFDFLGHRLFEPAPIHELDSPINLTKDDFGYDAKYADIAKLYTYPYAALSLSDNDGTTCNVRIENTGQLALHTRTSMVYPYLKAQAFLTGVNGEGGTTYEWRDVNGDKQARTAWNTPFSEFMASYDVPVYALFMDGATDWAIHNQRANVDAERLKALNGYHVAMRNANTGYENAKDGTNTGLTNTNASADTAYDNAVRSADTGQTNTNDAGDTTQANGNRGVETARANAKRSNTTAQTNANAAAATAKSNADDSATTAFDNAAASIDTTWQNSSTSNNLSKANTTRNIALNETNTERTNQYTATKGNLESEAAVANINMAMDYSTEVKNNAAEYMDNVGDVGNESAATTGIMSGIASIAGGFASGPESGAAASASAVVGLASLGVTIAKNNVVREAQKGLNSANLLALSNKNTAYINDFFQDGGIQKRSIARAQTYNTDINKNIRTTQTNNMNDTFNLTKLNIDKSRDTGNANNARTEATSLANNNRSYGTAVANAKRAFETAETNAEATRQTGLTNNEQSNELTHRNSQRTRDTGVTNATGTRGTTKANAKRSADTALNNALESREASEFANKTALEQAQDVMALSYSQHSTDKPVEFGSNSGEAAPDLFRYRGVQVRVLTQTKGQIAMAGDQMLRYGYAYTGAWSIAHLQLMAHYTYWKCSEVWFTSDTAIMEEARAAIRNLLENGVTVWSRPEEIGATSIYDNWRH